VLLLVACSNSSGAAAPPSPPAYRPLPPTARGGTLVIGDYEAPVDFDPLTAPTDASLRAASLVFAPLWTIGPGLHPYPVLADLPKVSVSGGTTTLDVRLRPSARWSDGSPVTAADVVLAWQAARDPATGAAPIAGLDHVRSLEARGDREVAWTLDSYGGYLAVGAALPPLPAARLAGVPHSAWRSSSFFAHPDLASGPFQVGPADPGAASLLPNPGWSGHPAYLDRVVLRTYPSKTAMLRALQSGESDLSFHLDASDLPALAGIPSARPSTTLGLRDEYLRPNPNAGPWASDPPVLDALVDALDRSERGLYPSPLAASNDPALPAPERDLTGARQALQADNWLPGADGVRAKGGRRLAFQLIAYCSSQLVTQTLDQVRDQLGQAGFAVDTACRPHADLIQADSSLGFEMALESNRWPPDPGGWAALGARCADSALTADFASGRYRSAAREWLRIHCTIPLFEWQDVASVTTRLRNFAPDPSGLDVWNAADWWLAG
jgi:peptide/nickel transport system substrate-binding protein